MWPINFSGDPEPNYRWSGVQLVNLQKKNGDMGATESSPVFITLVLSQPPHFDKGNTQNWNGLSKLPTYGGPLVTPDLAFFEALHIVLALMGYLLCNKQFLILFLNRAENGGRTPGMSRFWRHLWPRCEKTTTCSKHFTQEAFMNPLHKWVWEI